jgi:hypothetical protein
MPPRIGFGSLTLAFLLAAHPATAQEPAPFSVSGGFALLDYPKRHSAFGDINGFPAGWDLGAARGVSSLVSLEALVSGDYYTVQSPPRTPPVVEHRKYGMLGGVRASIARTRPVHLFGRALAGMTRVSYTTPSGFVTIAGVRAGFGETRNRFAMQVGAGADLRVSDQIAVRVTGDVRMTPMSRLLLAGGYPGAPERFGRGLQHEPRFSLALVVTP